MADPIRKSKFDALLLLLIALFPLVLMGIGLLLVTKNSGFSKDKILSKLNYDVRWEIDPLPQQQRSHLIQEVFPQKYYYLASGNQCYAFISEDRKYVMKFFKMQNLSPKDGLKSFPFSLVQKLGLENQAGNRLFSERIFTSYRDAYQSLRNETGLLYIHLNKSRDFQSKVTLIDNKGKHHLIDLDTVEFVVQKRAQRIFDRLNHLIEEENYEDLRSAIRSFFKLIIARCENGFVDQDSNIRNNYGFIDQTAVQFDCTTLTRDASMRYLSNLSKEVMENADRLDLWAIDNYPELTFFIQEEAQNVINHYSEAGEAVGIPNLKGGEYDCRENYVPCRNCDRYVHELHNICPHCFKPV